MEYNANNRLLWADILRITAIVFVVFLHSAAPLLDKFNNIPLFDWQVGNFYDSAMRSGVPLFIMLSGALLLGKEENIAYFLSKRFKRVIVPYFFWSIIFLLFSIYYENASKDLIRLGYRLFTGGVYIHLGFFNYFLGIYLFVPIMRKFVQESDREIYLYPIALWLIFSSIFPTVTAMTKLYTGKAAIFFISAPQFGGLFGYFIIGFVLRNYSNKKITVIAALGYSIGLALTVIGTYFLTVEHGKFIEELYRYNSPGVIVMSISIFILIKHFALKYESKVSMKIVSFISMLSKASFGVYFIHPIFLTLLGDGFLTFKVNGMTFNPLLAIPLTALTTLLLSYAVIMTLSKIPKIKYLIT